MKMADWVGRRATTRHALSSKRSDFEVGEEVVILGHYRGHLEIACGRAPRSGRRMRGVDRADLALLPKAPT